VAADSNTHMVLDCTEDADAVVGRAGFAHTYANEVPARGLSSEVRIIGQDPGNLGVRHA
jgi:hypothetical protein